MISIMIDSILVKMKLKMMKSKFILTKKQNIMNCKEVKYYVWEKRNKFR